MVGSLIDVLGTALDYTLLFITEWWPLLAIVAIAFIAPPLPRFFTRLGELFERAAARPWLIALLSLGWTALVVAMRGHIPLPGIHDDYASLLGGEMFARGRASYPTHPLWPHFEAFHVLQVPAYASKYPLGNQLLLAFGLRVTGIALVGSWLAAAAACVAVFWALRAALPARWAFGGACAAAIHPVVVNWGLSYRGGGLAALGGALVFGAMLRLMPDARMRLGAVAGAGLALLSVSRPFEGFVFATACALALLVQQRPTRALLGAAGAAIAVGSIGLAAVALHNRAITGSFTTLPWVEYSRQYDSAPQFVWQDAPPLPRYRNEEFRFIYERIYRTKYDRVTAPGGLLPELDRKLYFLRGALVVDPDMRVEPILWPLFLIPLIMLPRVLREERHARVCAIVLALFALAPFSTTGNLLTHYLAPVTVAVATLMLLLLRALCRDPRGRWIGVAIAVVFVLNAAVLLRATPHSEVEAERRALAASAGPGKHLFVVAPDVFDILYNEADVDAARVVWARDLGDNAALRAYFRDRTQWRVEKEGEKLRLRRLAPPQPSQSQK